MQHNVIIVDNGSGSEVTATLKKELDGLADIVVSLNNQGFAKGNNLGADYAQERYKPDYLLFVNNDLVFSDADVVDVLADRLDTLPSVGMIGPKVVGTDGKLQSPEPFLTFAQCHLLPYWGKLFFWKKNEDYALQAQAGFHYRIMGAFMLMRALDFKACGGMDPNTFLFSEESIMSERLKKIGKGVWYEPSVSVLHEHGATVTRYFDRTRHRRMKFESSVYYYKEYIGLPRWQYRLAVLTYKLKEFLGR